MRTACSGLLVMLGVLVIGIGIVTIAWVVTGIKAATPKPDLADTLFISLYCLGVLAVGVLLCRAGFRLDRRD